MLPFLLGERIYLRQLVEADAGGDYPAWFNDEQVCQGNSHHVYPYSREEAREYIRSVNADRSQLVLAICTKDGTHIGNVALQHIHPIYRSAEFAIVIGDKQCWGKGYGREAGRLIIGHGFKQMNLHRVGCGTFNTNIGMIRLAETLGMKLEGCKREAAYKNFSWLDIVEFGILREEWK